MEVFKKGEGKLARRFAFYSLLVLAIWGCRSLAVWLNNFAWARTKVFSGFEVEIPYYEQPLTYGVLASMLLNVAVGVILFKLLNKPRPAQTLIDTESELKKVTWPTWPEAKQATLIVLIFVAATAAYLTAVEFVLAKIFDGIF